MCRFAGETESYKAVSQAIRRIATAVRNKAEAREGHAGERTSVRSSLRSKTYVLAVAVGGFAMILTLR